jgi:glycosyltransferase involved in cell wall biosynthesis
MKADVAGDDRQEIGFDARWYTSTYPDCLATRLSPSEHYEKIGKLLGRAPGPGTSGALRPKGAPKVSVLCITYNHEKYIKQTLEGFCRQKSDFPVEFIVADDCSTDDTQKIIKEYAKRDKRIVPILHEKNLGVAQNFRSAAAQARGEYVALCEGDDYWIDSSKLRRQVEQMDADTDLSIVFHPVEVFNDADGKMEYVYPGAQPELTLWDLIFDNYIQTNSVMYRWRFAGGLPDWFDCSILPLDWYLHLCHAETGKIGYMDRVMAKYRKHDGGIWSSAAKEPQKLWRKYGLQQLRLFKAASKVAGGLFSDHTNHMFDYLIKEIFLDALVRQDRAMMAQLAKEHGAALVRLELLGDAGFGHLEAGMSDEAILARLSADTKISVVILSYNHAGYIEQCLNSVLRQTGFFELEVVVGDDCSSDDTLARVKAIAANHPNVKVLATDKNIGMLANMKRCLSACTGDFIAFCEGDDYWLGERKLLRQLAQMKRYPLVALSFNWVLLEHELDGQLVPHPGQSVQPERIPTAVIARDPLTANFSCCMYRADAVRKVPDSYFKEKGNADWMFNMHVAEWGGVGFLKELHSVYRLHSKGQWTGLTNVIQSELFSNARQKCSLTIGLGRGFDDYGVTCFVDLQKTSRNERFLFAIDQPENGNTRLLDSGCLQISGWVFDKFGKPLTLRLKNGTTTLDGKPDILRLDVARHFSKMMGVYISPICGFDLKPRFDLFSNEIEVFAVCEELEYKLATVRMFLAPAI